MSNYTKEETYQALLDPQVGDYFTEMFTYRAIVVKVESDRVWWVSGTPPSYSENKPDMVLPDDGKLGTMSRGDFIEHFTYSHNSTRPWVRLVDRGVDVTGWFDYLVESKEKTS